MCVHNRPQKPQEGLEWTVNGTCEPRLVSSGTRSEEREIPVKQREPGSTNRSVWSIWNKDGYRVSRAWCLSENRSTEAVCEGNRSAEWIIDGPLSVPFSEYGSASTGPLSPPAGIFRFSGNPVGVATATTHTLSIYAVQDLFRTNTPIVKIARSQRIRFDGKLRPVPSVTERPIHSPSSRTRSARRPSLPLTTTS